MTLILVRGSERYVTQAVDRLLTPSSGGLPFDAKSNKSIVYACRDGIVSIAYTGIAFLGNIPTDQWLVEQITGLQFDRDRKPASIGLGQNWEPTAGLGRTMQFVQLALQEVVKSIPVGRKREWQKQQFDLVAAGWTWNKRGRARPIIVRLCKQADNNEFQMNYTNRQWHYPRAQGIPFKVVAAPASNYTRQDVTMLKSLIANKTWQDAESVMVEEIRRIAEINSHVGKHALTVTLSPPKYARGFVTDRPVTPLVHSIRNSFFPDLKAEVHLSPWLIGRNVIQPPALLSHTEEVRLSNYTLTLSGPNMPGPMFLGSLQRKIPI